MENLKKGIYLGLGIALIIWSFYSFLQSPAPAHYQRMAEVEQLTANERVLRIGEESIIVEVADSDEERSLGLSGRESLEKGRGLFFVFETPGLYGFWMKDMRFAIDIIFLDANLGVINVYKGVDSSTFPTLFYPLAPAKYALEINSGETSRLGIDIGSKLFLDR